MPRETEELGFDPRPRRGQVPRTTPLWVRDGAHVWRVYGSEKIGLHIVLSEKSDPDEYQQVEAVHDDFPGWHFLLRIDRHGAIRGLNVEADGNAPEITARALRSFPLGALRDEVRVFVVQAYQHPGYPDPGVYEGLVRAWARGVAERPRPGRRGRPDLEYARLAALYVECLAEPRPLVALHQRLAGRREALSESQLRNMLYESRKRGLLTPARPGRAGGELTEKALRLLDQEA